MSVQFLFRCICLHQGLTSPTLCFDHNINATDPLINYLHFVLCLSESLTLSMVKEKCVTMDTALEDALLELSSTSAPADLSVCVWVCR